MQFVRGLKWNMLEKPYINNLCVLPLGNAHSSGKLGRLLQCLSPAVKRHNLQTGVNERRSVGGVISATKNTYNSPMAMC